MFAFFFLCLSHHCVFLSLFCCFELLWHSIRLNINLPICRCAFCIKLILSSFYALFGILNSEFRWEQCTNIHTFSGEYWHQRTHIYVLYNWILIGMKGKQNESKNHTCFHFLFELLFTFIRYSKFEQRNGRLWAFNDK